MTFSLLLSNYNILRKGIEMSNYWDKYDCPLSDLKKTVDNVIKQREEFVKMCQEAEEKKERGEFSQEEFNSVCEDAHRVNNIHKNIAKEMTEFVEESKEFVKEQNRLDNEACSIMKKNEEKYGIRPSKLLRDFFNYDDYKE